MFKKLKRRFITLAMISMAVTLIASFTAVNFSLRTKLANRADEIIAELYINGGSFPAIGRFDTLPESGLLDETPFKTRYYVAYVNQDSTIIGADYSHIAINNIEGVRKQILQIMSSDKQNGYIANYRYGRFDSELGEMIIVVDCTTDLQIVDNLLKITLITITSCIAVVFIILQLMSKYVLRPFEENRDKQRRFITDAGHELKTPIAIIQSNAEVLEMTEGENKWLTNIKNQTARMNTLVRELTELSKMSEGTLSEKEKQRILFSDIVTDSVDSFKVLANAKGIDISANIMPNIYIDGDLEGIVRLVGILTDNAVKYTDNGGVINISLYRKSKRVYLKVTNPCAGLDRTSIPKFFDRFYRSDDSRNSDTGGYGIGLSMAQMIVQSHKGKLTVNYTADEIVVFSVEF